MRYFRSYPRIMYFPIFPSKIWGKNCALYMAKCTNLAATESGLECAYVNNDNFTVLVREGGRRRWVCMYIVQQLHPNWLSKQSNESASDFALSLNIPCRNYLDDSGGHSYQQLVIGSFVTTMYLLMHHVSCSFLVEHHHPGDSASLQPRFGAQQLLGFPKTKIRVSGKRLRLDDIQENTTRQVLENERNVWGPKVPTLKESEASLSYVQYFLYLASS